MCMMCEMRREVKRDPKMRAQFEEMIKHDSPEFQKFARAMLDSKEGTIDGAMEDAMRTAGPKAPARKIISAGKTSTIDKVMAKALVDAAIQMPEHADLTLQEPVQPAVKLAGQEPPPARADIRNPILGTIAGRTTAVSFHGPADAELAKLDPTQDGALPGGVTITVPTDVALAMVELGTHVAGDGAGNGGSNPRTWFEQLGDQLRAALPKPLAARVDRKGKERYWTTPQVGLIQAARWEK